MSGVKYIPQQQNAFQRDVQGLPEKSHQSPLNLEYSGQNLFQSTIQHDIVEKSTTTNKLIECKLSVPIAPLAAW